MTISRARKILKALNKKKSKANDDDSSSDEGYVEEVTTSGPKVRATFKHVVEDLHNTSCQLDDVVVTDLWIQEAETACINSRSSGDSFQGCHSGLSYNPVPAERKILVNSIRDHNIKFAFKHKPVNVRTSRLTDYEHEVDIGPPPKGSGNLSEQKEAHVTPRSTYKTRSAINKIRRKRSEMKAATARSKQKDLRKQFSCISKIAKDVLKEAKKCDSRRLALKSAKINAAAQKQAISRSFGPSNQFLGLPPPIKGATNLSSVSASVSNPFNNFIDRIMSKGLIESKVRKPIPPKSERRRRLRTSRRKTVEIYSYRNFDKDTNTLQMRNSS